MHSDPLLAVRCYRKPSGIHTPVSSVCNAHLSQGSQKRKGWERCEVLLFRFLLFINTELEHLTFLAICICRKYVIASL